MKNIFQNKTFIRILLAGTILWALFVVYQILRKVFGGSWAIEEVILGMAFINITATISMAVLFGYMKADISYMKNDIKSVKKELKEFRKDCAAFRNRLGQMI